MKVEGGALDGISIEVVDGESVDATIARLRDAMMARRGSAGCRATKPHPVRLAPKGAFRRRTGGGTLRGMLPVMRAIATKRSALVAGISILVACATSPRGVGRMPCGRSFPGAPACSYVCTLAATVPLIGSTTAFPDDNGDGTDGVVATCLFVASDGIDSPDAGIRIGP